MFLEQTKVKDERGSMMKKFISILFTFMLLFSFLTAKAEAVNTADVQLRDDLILNIMTPLIFEAVEEHYGEPKQVENLKILKIKKRDSFFDVTVQGTTFEGAHNPPNDLVEITFRHYQSTGWREIEFKRKWLHSNE